MTLISNQLTIGFIGTGVMGRSMAANVMTAGYKLLVYNRTKAKAADLIEAGATWKETVAQVAAESDVIITVVGYPEDVEQTYLGEDGLIQHARSGSTLIDMTTSK